MRVKIQNGSTVDLSKRDFVAQGGEGSVYVKGQTAFKIYTDQSKVIPEGKIRELAAITDPNVVRPQALLLDKNSHPIGYTMRAIPKSHSLVQLFTKAFRDRNGLTQELMQALIQRLRDMVQNTHDAHVLVVDLNEMNYLVTKAFDDIFGIDVDSYQTKGYPATALMESVRDRHSNGTFSEKTDWFAFAIISFQMFIGIHPYKGKHPSIKNINDRMIQNVSVMNSSVSMPRVCYPLDVIPETYRKWYQHVLEEGGRTEPPVAFEISTPIVQAVFRHITGSNNFNIDELLDLKGDVITVQSHGATRALTTQRFYFNQSRSVAAPPHQGIRLCKTPTQGTPVGAWIERGQLKLYDFERQEDIHVSVGCTDLMEYEGRLYVVSGENLLLISFLEHANHLVVAPDLVGHVLPRATRAFDGCLIQNLLGSFYVSVLSKPKEHRQLQIKELDGYRIADAKYDSHVLMVSGLNKKTKQYDRIVIRFDSGWTGHDVRIVADVPTTGLNFTTLDSGVVICLNENEDIEVFSNKKDSAAVRIISDPILGGDMRMARTGSTALICRGSKVFRFSMNKKA